MPEVRPIPLPEIDEAALARDRTAHDAAALDELEASIAASGLRMPVEVYALAAPAGPHRYGLISGFRRLAAFRALHQSTGAERYAAIPAFPGRASPSAASSPATAGACTSPARAPAATCSTPSSTRSSAGSACRSPAGSPCTSRPRAGESDARSGASAAAAADRQATEPGRAPAPAPAPSQAPLCGDLARRAQAQMRIGTVA
jgi:hypothetical protein